ncbi:TetR/AcrR family transcriptional regulator [Cypionkella sp.]|jgi:AcrR family transcriptional regulator|uniref:TetR/AcrR family transcriptional regulator n=1 Tax=Cypionkella sp. TaxID=2811411 RepID=UPI002715CDE6|nr:TetR/AcrR family transcriptional regulator [Cypionkella sp.]MDO8982494.1 TetR/AcrR family transcriptional regulator [Cypionkella sp.]MDP1578177.1 TetR/AcrR family transcriptional regulator [Cypionkella sp.]MDP2050497.1 TetR/AcrR family transcriptional regulator [Cypionkella sp.]
MDTGQTSERGWRGTPEIWLDAAYALLVEGGVEAVKVMPLAARLGLSRTSFYWHFADREALLAGLIARWQSQNTANLIARTQAPAATIAQAMLNVNDCWITPALFDSRMEFAIRTWALTDSSLAEVLKAADLARVQALTGMFETFSYPPHEARVRAQTVYLTQVGYISMRTEESLEFRLHNIPDYVLIFTGKAPTAAELAAFRARNQAG